jgi:iron complex transport system permease protein
VIVAGYGGTSLLPVAAFGGAVLAVALTYVVAASGAERAGGYAIILAGVAVAAMLTAIQTYLQQQHSDQMRQIYNWILGSFAFASWSDVWLVLPYVAVAAAVLLAHRRILDVLRVGGDEAATLGVHPGRASLIVIAAATLGTAAVVSVSGLIGFVGIVAPHAVRLVAGASYRVLLPVAMIGGGAFLVLADLVARTIQSPSEVPIGVITAFVGGPFFLLVLRSRRSHHGVL